MDHALAAERDRSAAELEAERRRRGPCTACARGRPGEGSKERDAQAVIEARVAERQAHLAAVERLLGAVNAIDSARSLSDTLTA